MRIHFTSNREMVEAMVETLKSRGYALDRKMTLVGHNHNHGFSTVAIELQGALSDLIFLGMYTQCTADRIKQSKP